MKGHAVSRICDHRAGSSSHNNRQRDGGSACAAGSASDIGDVGETPFFASDILALDNTPGLCVNTGACALARSGRPVMVAIGSDFLCPACGMPLTPPVLPRHDWARLVPVVLEAALVLVVVGGARAWYDGTTREGAPAAPGAAQVISSPPPRKAAIAPGRKTVASFVILSGVQRPAPPVDRPFVPTPLRGGAPAYPAALAADGRPGRVMASCMIMPDGRPRDCTASSARGSGLFEASVLTWLQSGGVVFAPILRDGQAVQERQSWQVSVVEGEEALRNARRLLRPPQSGSDDSEPAFPEDAADTDQSGSVTVDCLVGTDGRASDCRTVRKTGGARFVDSVMRWLNRPRTRLPTATEGGKKVAARRTLNVEFTP